eukprot:3368881-Pleurochrysis_carterae.AAC.1
MCFLPRNWGRESELLSDYRVKCTAYQCACCAYAGSAPRRAARNCGARALGADDVRCGVARRASARA